MHPDPQEMNDTGELAEALADIVDTMLPEDLESLRRGARRLKGDTTSPTLSRAAEYIERMAEVTLSDT